MLSRPLLISTAVLCLLTGSALARDVPVPGPVAVKPIKRGPDKPEILPVRPNGAAYITGDWTYPTAEAVKEFYPPRAHEDEIDGAVTLDCEVRVDGSVSACELISENPRGYAFGASTITMFIKHARLDPASIPGGLKAGSWHRFAYKWMFAAQAINK